MLEDSINSSPHKNNRSIHKARLQRKNRRRCGLEIEENESGTSECVANTTKHETTRGALQETVASLSDMYWENDEHPNSSNMNKTFKVQPQKYGGDFDPFEDELLLAVADRLDCAQAQAQLNNQKIKQLKTSQGFHKCLQLLSESEDKLWGTEDENNAESPTKTYKPPITNGPKTQFGITESELLHFCAAAEEENESVAETPPPKKHKSIVESILEDFCSSPLSLDGQEQHCSHINYAKSSTGKQLTDIDDRTPVFRFKNKPLRTYSCRRSKTGVRTSIAKRLESVASMQVNADEDDNLSNCSSGLSVQEDLTQHTEAPLDSVDINKSIKVCENLLNLSAYFTQQSILDATPTSNSVEIFRTTQDISQGVDTAINTFEDYCATAAQLIEQIITMQKEYRCDFRKGNSSDTADFQGFPAATKKVEDRKLDTSFVCRNVLDETTFLPKDDCAAGMFEDEINSTSSLTDRISTERDMNCSSLLQSSKRADELFSDSEDEWHDDCDFFKHFKTQDALHKYSAPNDSTTHSATPSEIFNGFMSTSKKPIKISETAQQRAARILAEVDNKLEVSEVENVCNAINVPAEALKTKELTLEKDKTLPGFQTASKKQIKISKDAIKRAHAVLSDLPVIPLSTKENLDFVESFKTKTNIQKQCNIVNIDEVELGDIQLSEWLIDDGLEKLDPLKTLPAFKGFETASKKHIKISEAAKNQALKIFKDLPNLPKSATDKRCEIPEDFEASKSSKDLAKDVVDRAYSVCTGFRTASRKSINISSEAKERAAKILETLPDFLRPISKNSHKAAENLEEIQLSEWPLNDSSNNAIDETPLTTQRKFEDITEDLKKYIQTPEQTAKILDKSFTKNNLHRTPLTPHIDNDTLGASNSSTPLTKHHCLTSFAKSAIISRKNLLSLSKRKKIKYNQDIKSIQETLGTPSAGHNTRMPTAPVTPNVQEFFAAVPNTSTPRPIRVRTEAPANSSTIDMDFKHIEWEQGTVLTTLNNTKTPSSTKLNSSCENITLISTNPSPKMRIARLHMYGKPPPVSPILMSSINNCRPSGLRRGRSMQKQ